MRIGTSGLGVRGLFIAFCMMLVSACSSPITIGPAATEVPAVDTVSAEAVTITPEEVETVTDVPPTPTVVVEPTAAPTAQCTVKGVVGLNFRAGPGTEFASLAKLEAREALTATGKSTEGDWVAATRADGLQGWVASTYIDCGDAIPQLPVATPSTVP